MKSILRAALVTALLCVLTGPAATVGGNQAKGVAMRAPKSLIVAAMALGIAGGSYGIASAASGNGTTTTTTTTATAPAASTPAAGGQPWGRQRSDETPLPASK